MSEIQVGQINSTDGSTAITTGAGGYVSFAKTQIGGRRKLIIKGAMQVAQRGNTSGSNGLFTADRFQHRASGLGGAGAVVETATQSTVLPSGFNKALKIDVTTAGSGFSADDISALSYKFEHQDITHLLDAGNDLTLSFWCRSSLATTYGFTVWLGNRDTTSGGNVYATTFTVNTANTWEQKTITIPAPTSSRSGGDDNAVGMQLYWSLELISGGTKGSATADAWSDSNVANQVTAAATDTGWVSSTNDFYITGVQLEVGTVATPFEHRSYGEELALCHRYYQAYEGSGAKGFAFDGLYASGAGSGLSMSWAFPIQMRSSPSHTKLYNDTQNVSSVNVATTIYGVQLETIASGSGRTAYKANGSGYIRFDAEL